MFDIIYYPKHKCERCGIKNDTIDEKIFGIYATRLCTKCWREWNCFIMGNKDYLGMLATTQKYSNANDKEREGLHLLSIEILKELYPVLEQWLSRSN